MLKIQIPNFCNTLQKLMVSAVLKQMYTFYKNMQSDWSNE